MLTSALLLQVHGSQSLQVPHEYWGVRTSIQLAKESDKPAEAESEDLLKGISDPEEDEQQGQTEHSAEEGQQQGESKQSAGEDQQQPQPMQSAGEDQQHDSSKQSAGQSAKQTMPAGQRQDSAAPPPAEMEPQLEQLIREFIPQMTTLQLAQLTGEDCSNAKAAVLNWVEGFISQHTQPKGSLLTALESLSRSYC